MKLTVYRQSSKTRPDGKVVYKGEDALPYIDEQIFFVADGLGGAAAIRHQKIKQELSAELKELIGEMQRVFGTKVNAIGNDRKGRIYIDYYTRDDLDRLSEILEYVKNNKK